jgi:uncharacterized protein (TIGR02246 family)
MQRLEETNENQIGALVERWASAVRAGDMEGVLAGHTDDIVIFDVPPPLRSKGIAAYKKAWELFFSYQPKGGFDLSELIITADDTVAFCHGLLRVGSEKRPAVRLTMGFRKVRGEWRIAHEHHSAPYEG